MENLHLILIFVFSSHLPPSQGGKYAGFGNSCNPPPRSASTNDFYEAGMGGLTNVSNFPNHFEKKIIKIKH